MADSKILIASSNINLGSLLRGMLTFPGDTMQKILLILVVRITSQNIIMEIHFDIIIFTYNHHYS